MTYAIETRTETIITPTKINEDFECIVGNTLRVMELATKTSATSARFEIRRKSEDEHGEII